MKRLRFLYHPNQIPMIFAAMVARSSDMPGKQGRTKSVRVQAETLLRQEDRVLGRTKRKLYGNKNGFFLLNLVAG